MRLIVKFGLFFIGFLLIAAGLTYGFESVALLLGWMEPRPVTVGTLYWSFIGHLILGAWWLRQGGRA